MSSNVFRVSRQSGFVTREAMVSVFGQFAMIVGTDDFFYGISPVDSLDDWLARLDWVRVPEAPSIPEASSPDTCGAMLRPGDPDRKGTVYGRPIFCDLDEHAAGTDSPVAGCDHTGWIDQQEQTVAHWPWHPMEV